MKCAENKNMWKNCEQKHTEEDRRSYIRQRKKSVAVSFMITLVLAVSLVLGNLMTAQAESDTDETSITVNTVWSDADNRDGIRPDRVTVYLLANNETVRQAIITADDNWSCTFDDLPVYADESEISYTVSGDPADGYTPSVDGYTITYSHTPETFDITVTNVWDDANDQDGIRPDSITIYLMENGSAVDYADLSADNNWTYTFMGLGKYASGEEIAYTISELDITGYSASLSGSSGSGYTITNTHVPQTTDITVTKTWNDNNDADGIRPDSITVHLYADGEEAAVGTVTADDEWSYTFSDLTKYRDGGTEIVYTIEEDEVSGYTATYDGYDITNTHTVTKATSSSDDSSSSDSSSSDSGNSSSGNSSSGSSNSSSSGSSSGSGNSGSSSSNSGNSSSGSSNSGNSGSGSSNSGSISSTTGAKTGDAASPIAWSVTFMTAIAAFITIMVSSRRRAAGTGI